MNLVIALVIALGAGLAFRQRLGAHLAYISGALFVFTWASVVVIAEWAAGDTAALGPFPEADQGQVIAFGVVNLVVLILGVGVVEVGQRLRARMTTGRRAAVDLSPRA